MEYELPSHDGSSAMIQLFQYLVILYSLLLLLRNDLRISATNNLT